MPRPPLHGRRVTSAALLYTEPGLLWDHRRHPACPLLPHTCTRPARPRSSVRAFADAFRSRHSSLHLLLNNAGEFHPGPFALTGAGLERTLAPNYWGHFYLSHCLLDLLVGALQGSAGRLGAWAAWYPRKILAAQLPAWQQRGWRPLHGPTRHLLHPALASPSPRARRRSPPRPRASSTRSRRPRCSASWTGTTSSGRLAAAARHALPAARPVRAGCRWRSNRCAPPLAARAPRPAPRPAPRLLTSIVPDLPTRSGTCRRGDKYRDSGMTPYGTSKVCPSAAAPQRRCCQPAALPPLPPSAAAAQLTPAAFCCFALPRRSCSSCSRGRCSAAWRAAASTSSWRTLVRAGCIGCIGRWVLGPGRCMLRGRACVTQARAGLALLARCWAAYRLAAPTPAHSRLPTPPPPPCPRLLLLLQAWRAPRWSTSWTPRTTGLQWQCTLGPRSLGSVQRRAPTTC
jgi:NAD(P)-dependent dehydrogenase (short-subunit alcohol dehydrogenase family)